MMNIQSIFRNISKTLPDRFLNDRFSCQITYFLITDVVSMANLLHTDFSRSNSINHLFVCLNSGLEHVPTMI